MDIKLTIENSLIILLQGFLVILPYIISKGIVRMDMKNKEKPSIRGMLLGYINTIITVSILCIFIPIIFDDKGNKKTSALHITESLSMFIMFAPGALLGVYYAYKKNKN